MKVIIVGAGIGGLACAIACCRRKLDVLVLEQCHELLSIDAGIQIPPNGTRIMQEFDLVPQLLEKGTVVESMDLRRYKDGRVLTSMPCAETVAREYGAPWIVIHRADYYRILLDRAKLLGAEIRNRFRKMLSCIPAVLKWKLYHLPELSTWTNKVIIDLIESVRGSTPSPKRPFGNNA